MSTKLQRARIIRQPDNPITNNRKYTVSGSTNQNLQTANIKNGQSKKIRDSFSNQIPSKYILPRFIVNTAGMTNLMITEIYLKLVFPAQSKFLRQPSSAFNTNRNFLPTDAASNNWISYFTCSLFVKRLIFLPLFSTRFHITPYCTMSETNLCDVKNTCRIVPKYSGTEICYDSTFTEEHTICSVCFPMFSSGITWSQIGLDKSLTTTR